VSVWGGGRLLMEAELELATLVYWDSMFWEDQLKA
jgi:hypothetical protein